MVESVHGKSGSNTFVLVIVLVLMGVLLLVGSVAAVFFFAYFSFKSVPPAAVPMPGQPAWRVDVQPGDSILEIHPSDSPPVYLDLQEGVVLGDNDEIEIIREGENGTVQLKLKSVAEPALLDQSE